MFGFSLIQTQEYTTLFLGVLAFVFFNYREMRYRKNKQEKTQIQKEISRMSKDLNHSYTYIGEINRKLDILENITAGFPETSKLPNEKKIEIYESIMSAIQMLSKSDDFILRFINQKNHQTLKEFRSNNNKTPIYQNASCPHDGYFFENDEFIYTKSQKSIDNVYSCIIIKKKNSNKKTDDPEILKTLAMQALFLFMFIQEKNAKRSKIEKNN
jgi:hypothetical protein